MRSKALVAAVLLASLLLVTFVPVFLAPAAPAAPASIHLSVSPSAPVPSATLRGQWTYLGTHAPARDAPSWVYDSHADRFVLFGGGTSSTSVTNQTAVYDYKNGTWTDLTLIVAPAPRIGAMMVYDSRADRVILFGGAALNLASYSDTWAFDVSNRTWSNVTLGIGPQGRTYASMTYDIAADRTILFGGFSGGFLLADTWTFEYANSTWTQRPASNPPTNRYAASMVWDPVTRESLLFGGGVFNGYTVVFQNDLYHYDYAGDVWTLLQPPGPPTGRGGAAMAYNTLNHTVVLFGGSNGFTTASYRNDTWAYSVTANRWTNITPASSPSPRVDVAMDYDAKADRMVLFGGALSSGAGSAEAWAFGFLAPDVTPPTIAITVPSNGTMVSAANLTVNGTASDNVAVSSVQVSLNGTTWAPATGTGTWTAKVHLQEGTNKVYARATDSSGNTATVWINVTYQVPSTGFLGVSTTTWIIIVIVIVAAAAGVAILLMRRRRKPAPAPPMTSAMPPPVDMPPSVLPPVPPPPPPGPPGTP